MLSVKNVSAGYDDQDILHDISFDVTIGENLSIIGPNGCGKTTLLRTMANIIPFRGEILLNGINIKDIPRKQLAQKIALLSQITQIYFGYSVYDTVMMGRYAYQKRSVLSSSSKEDQQIVEEALNVLHLNEIKDKQINQLSGGQLQRVFLAKIIVQEPEIILLDEPTNHLDLYYQVELIEFLKQWAAKKKRTVIGVLHDMNLAIQLSEQILIMKDGTVKALGSAKEVLQPDCLQNVFGFDVNEYMKQAYGVWEQLEKE